MPGSSNFLGSPGFTDRTVVRPRPSYGGGATSDTEITVDVTSASTKTNSMLCMVMTCILVLAGVGVATWYTVSELTSDDNDSIALNATSA